MWLTIIWGGTIIVGCDTGTIGCEYGAIGDTGTLIIGWTNVC